MAMRFVLGFIALALVVDSCLGGAITSEEVDSRKGACLADINSGLWGFKCKTSVIVKQNCVLRCVSPACYDRIYGADPLEEGEVDTRRGNEFMHCVKRESQGQDISKGSFYE